MKKNKYVVDNQNPHLGGNLIFGDPATWSPLAWTYLIGTLEIKTMIDLGSGLGHTSKWFADNNIIVTAVDGLKYNVEQSIYPTILHDITKTPFLQQTDLVYCVEVVEHIDEIYLENLLESLNQGKYIFLTHAIPGQEGWHHVNCRESNYWIDHISKKGYQLLDHESLEVRNLAQRDNAVHIARNAMIFVKLN